jgi:electron transport complex protein RnfC
LVQYFRYAKGEIRQERRDTFESDRARQRFENRQARLEREQVEKELRRKARAEAAAKALAEKKAKEGNDAPAKDDPIKAALERAAAKRAEKTEAPHERSVDELKDLAEKAKAKFEKAAARLKDAEENGNDMLAALNKAAGKLEEKHRAADKAYQEAVLKQEESKT